MYAEVWLFYTHVDEFDAICPNFNTFNSIERLILDFNCYNKKTGRYAPIRTELINSLKQMKSIQHYLLVTIYNNGGKIKSKTLYLLEYDYLIPLFKYINNDTNNTNKKTNNKKNSLQFYI